MKTPEQRPSGLLDFDKRFRAKSTDVWERILGLFTISSNDPALDYLTKADRIEKEPIARGAPLALYGILLFIFLILLWAALAELDRVTVGRGVIVSNDPNIVLQVSENAEIVEMNLRVGQRVKKGEVLVRLDPTISEADRQEIALRLESVQRELQDLQKEKKAIDNKGASFSSSETRYFQNITRLRESIRLTEAQVTISQSRVRSARQVVEMNRDLFDKNFLSKKLVIDSEDKLLEAEKELLSSRNQLNSYLRELNSLNASLNTSILELSREQDSLSQRLLKADRRSEKIALISPRDAIVLELSKLSKGSIAKAAEPLITLVPADAKMRVEATISSSDIAGIKLGQPARVKLDTFPFQRYGFLEGTVSNLTRDSIEQQAVSGSQRVYPVTVEVDDFTLESSKTSDSILPGMTLSVEIVTGNRSVISYLFDPLLKIADEGLNE